MDGKQYPFRCDVFETNAERVIPRVERRKENPFLFNDSSVDPVNTGAIQKVNRFLSPRYVTMEQQSFLPTDQLSQEDSEAQYLEQSERIDRKLQQSIMLLNHKQQMQHKILLMQQQQIQQQQQIHQQQQIQQQRQVQHQYQTEQPQQPQVIVQQRQTRQWSPERQRPDPSVESQTGQHQKPEHSHIAEAQKAQCPETSDTTASLQDLFMQCQSLLDVINACTDLQQMIKHEMKKQAKLDNIICQKLLSKAQRLHQQSSILEKAHAPSWVGPALLDLGSHVTHQAEAHHIYTTIMMEQSVVIQHSLDGYHELMKSVLGEHSERKQKPVSLADVRSKSTSPSADKRSQVKVADEVGGMTFLQASNIFEGIRKPRMKLLSALEYQQEQLNATIMHLGEVDAKIEALTNEDSENLMWRTQLHKKDLEIRKEFLEARKEQLESDVQFAKMDVSDFEFSHKDSLLEVLDVFREHRIRYDAKLRKNFQLLKAASVRDINQLRWLTKKSESDANTEFEPGDISEGLIMKQNDPWSCASKTVAKMTSLTIPGDKEQDSASTPLSGMYSRSTSPQVSKKRSPYLYRNAQEQIDTKIITTEQTYPIVLSSDSEISDVQKSVMYSPELKPVKLPTVNSFNVSQFQNMSDFNFSRAESSPSIREPNNALADGPVVAEMTKAPGRRTVNEKLQSIKENMLQSTEDDTKLIISRYVGYVKGCENQPVKNSFHSGTEDMMVVTCGPKPRLTLGNFENSVDSECSIHCLYPMSSLRENPRKKEEKRVSHLINKYASGSRSGRSSFGKNWNSSKPMLWSGISRGLIRDNCSRRKVNRGFRYCKVLTQHHILTEYNENSHVSNMEPVMTHFKEQNMNNSEILQGQNNPESFACITQWSEENIRVKSLHGCRSSEVDDGNKHASSVFSEHTRQDLSMCDCESVGEQRTGGSVNLTESMTRAVGEDLKLGAADCQSVTQNLDKCEQIPGQESRNLNKCEQIPGQESRNLNNCEHIQGQESRNLNNCEQIPGQESRNLKKFEQIQGQESRNLNNCEQIPGQESRNLKKCEQIQGQESRNLNKCEQIQGQESRNLNKCEQIPGQESRNLNNCEQIPGQESRNLNKCEQIQGQESRNLNKCEQIPMRESKNLNNCEQIPGQESRNLNKCEQIQGQESKNLNNCEQIPGQESRNLNKCEQIQGQESRNLNKCEQIPMRESKNLNNCEQIPEQESRNLNKCEQIQGQESKNLNNCEQIPGQESRNLNNCEQIPGQESRNLNKCEQIQGQESKNLNNCEQIPGQESRNLNNCEHLPGQESRNLIKCEHLPGQESRNLIKCEHLPGQESRNLIKCEHLPGQESRNLIKCEHLPGQESRNLIKCEHLPGQESRNLIKCEHLPGQESRNLNNCEPLKSRVVDAEVVVEREDQMDFEVIQALCPDSQPRQVRVCAVRPISSEVDRGGSGQTVAKGLPSQASGQTVAKGLPSQASGQTVAKGLPCETFEDPHARRGLSCKYDNLKVYEITAGQFTISELETDCKSRNTMESNKVDCGNIKRPDFNNFSSQVLPNQDCLKKLDVSSCKNHVCESTSRDTPKIKIGRTSVFMNCELLTSAKTNVEYSADVNSEAVMCPTAVRTEQFTSGEDTSTVLISAEATIRGILSVPELHPQATKKIQNLQSMEFTRSDNVYGHQKSHLDKDQANNKCDEDQTLSKTLYRPEKENVKQKGVSDSGYKLKDATGSTIPSLHNTLQERGCAKVMEHGEVTNRQLARILPIEDTRDEPSEAVRTISGQIVSTHRDALVLERMNCKEVQLFVEDEFRPKVEIRKQNKAKNGETATSQAFYKSMIEMSNFTSQQASSHIKLQKESDTDERHSLATYNQDYTRKLEKQESLDETKIYINNTQQQAQNRPLKSSLKKSCAVSTSGQMKSSERKESCECFLQCGAPDVTTGQLIAQRESSKIHKCFKQVRFDHKIHYDDNTVTDSLDSTISHENKPALPYPTNANKNCTESVNVHQDEMLMYSAIRTSYFTNNCNSSTGRDSHCDFSNNGFSLM